MHEHGSFGCLRALSDVLNVLQEGSETSARVSACGKILKEENESGERELGQRTTAYSGSRNRFHTRGAVACVHVRIFVFANAHL